MAHINLLTKRVAGREYIITDFIATRLNEKQFKHIQAQNDFLKDYDFTPYSDTDFSWWVRVDKKLTSKKLVKGVCYDIDFHGNVTEY